MAKPRRYVIVGVAVAVIAALLMAREPANPACQALRETLKNHFKVHGWYRPTNADGNPKPMRFPRIPTSVISACGADSFQMEYPFTFRFDDNPLPEAAVVDELLRLNKTVAVRPLKAGEESVVRPFAVSRSTSHGQRMAPFSKAWDCISNSSCFLYFDNTWHAQDMASILPENRIVELIQGTQFGNAFVSKFTDQRLTAYFHAAPMKSIALQVTGRKLWHFLSPEVTKQRFVPLLHRMITFTSTMGQKQEDVIRATPRYLVETGPGDGVYFAAFWSHMVETDKDLSVMVNFRQPIEVAHVIKNSPHTLANTLKLLMGACATNYLIPEGVFSKLREGGQDRYQAGKRLFEEYALEIDYYNREHSDPQLSSVVTRQRAEQGGTAD